MALGAVQALQNTDNIGKILVVGTDGDKEAVDSIEQGLLSATVAQDSSYRSSIFRSYGRSS